MPDSQDSKQVNNDLRNAQFGGGLINADTVNAGRIGGDIYNIHIGQQMVASSDSAQSQNQRQRSQQEQDSLEKAYTLQSQKVASLRNAWVIQSDPLRKFQYEQQLQEEERTLNELGERLSEIEQCLKSFKNSGTETDNKIYVPIENDVISQPTKIKLKTSDGNESASLRAAAHWISGVKQDKTVTFILPAGYIRHSFSESVNRDGISSGGYVCWESDYPHDARIRLHAWADAPNGISNVSVSEVWGITEDAI
nr:hypothetical protein [Dendronalium sp. ChiSLP03b]MDZ8208994.1 hypothetical protein [Dendronalium sp. ChiSLP03b]